MFVRGMGIGFAFMPAMAAAFASLERSELSDATPQLNVLQRVGGSIGTAVLAVVLAARARRRAHARAARPQAYGTAFWWSRRRSTALAIVPCIVLLRAERAARAGAAARDAERQRTPAESVARGGGGMSARRASEALDAARPRRSRASMAAVRRLRGRETHRPGELSFAQYSLLFGLATSGELLDRRARAGRRPLAGDASRRCSTASRRPASSSASAPSATGASC